LHWYLRPPPPPPPPPTPPEGPSDGAAILEALMGCGMTTDILADADDTAGGDDDVLELERGALVLYEPRAPIC